MRKRINRRAALVIALTAVLVFSAVLLAVWPRIREMNHPPIGSRKQPDIFIGQAERIAAAETGSQSAEFFEKVISDRKEAVKKADEIFAQVDPDLSDYEKMLVFYDKIVDETDYAVNDHDQDMTSVFLDKASVCAGYARAFQYLCKKAGIECAYIEGTAYGFQDANEEAHAWNLVKLDDKYYWVDVTWGDPLSEDEKYDKTYSYFCSDDEEFFKTHEPAPTAWKNDGYGNITTPLYVFELPECTDSSKDYYKLNGSYFEDYDRGTLGEYIGNKLTEDTEAVVEFKMGGTGAYYSAMSDLFEDRVYVYDIISDYLGDNVAENRDVYYIQDDKTGVISLFLE